MSIGDICECSHKISLETLMVEEGTFLRSDHLTWNVYRFKKNEFLQKFLSHFSLNIGKIKYSSSKPIKIFFSQYKISTRELFWFELAATSLDETKISEVVSLINNIDFFFIKFHNIQDSFK